MIFKGPPLAPELLRENLSIPQFLLDSSHPSRPPRSTQSPAWLIDDCSGREYGLDEVRNRTFGLANAMAAKYGIKEDDVVLIFSPNDIDYPIAVWAIHRLLATASCANPSFTESELEYQISATKANFVITHPLCLPVVLPVFKHLGIPTSRIVLIQPYNRRPHPLFAQAHKQPPLTQKAANSVLDTSRSIISKVLPISSPPSEFVGPRPFILTPAQLESCKGFATVDELVELGLGAYNTEGPRFTERKLEPGEGRKKLAFLSFSSGTTGRPKAVAISHASVNANVIQMAVFLRSTDMTHKWEERRCRDGDVSLGVLPMFHIYGLVVVLHLSVFMGLPLVVIPKYNFIDLLDSIIRYRITHLWVVPPMIVSLVKHPATQTHRAAIQHVRLIQGGAASLSPELEASLRQILPNANIGQAYGLTESSTTLTMWPPSQTHGGTPGSAGQLISGVEAKVLKEDGSLAGYDEQGELVARAPSIAIGYANNEEATKDTFRDGWLHTGDEVIIKPNGDVFIVDRLKEIFKVRGFQVAPAELEGLLLGHPSVNDVGVIGVPDEYSGEKAMAFVVLKEGVKADQTTREALMKHVADHKVRYKWLDGGLEFVDLIPKNPSGKILRRVLRDQAKALHAEEKPVSAKL